MSRRALTIGGGVLAAAGGYYFYQAGGDPKVAKEDVRRKYILFIALAAI